MSLPETHPGDYSRPAETGRWTHSTQRQPNPSIYPPPAAQAQDSTDPDMHRGCLFGRCTIPTVLTLACRCFVGAPVGLASALRSSYRAYYSRAWDGSRESVEALRDYKTATAEMRDWLAQCAEPQPRVTTFPAPAPDEEPGPVQGSLF